MTQRASERDSGTCPPICEYGNAGISVVAAGARETGRVLVYPPNFFGEVFSRQQRQAMASQITGIARSYSDDDLAATLEVFLASKLAGSSVGSECCALADADSTQPPPSAL